jgi:Sortilin, neurotensin receptor 3,
VHIRIGGGASHTAGNARCNIHTADRGARRALLAKSQLRRARAWRTRTGIMSRMLRATLIAVALLLGTVAAPRAVAVLAQSSDTTGNAPDWTDTPLTSATTRLFTPSSGALLASTADGLMRSDDAGETWYAVASEQRVVYVDPSNQDTLFATASGTPLLRSADGGATWTPLLAGPDYAGRVLDAVAVSPADPNLIYAGLKRPSISDEYWLYRSSDSGATWTQLFHSQNTLCGWGVQVLQPHPSDVNRLLFAGGCHAGRDFSERVKQSTNQGQAFTDFYANGLANFSAPSGFPRAVLGGQGAASARWYLAINRDQRFGGSSLLRSDDDGASWDLLLNHVGGGSNDPDTSNWSVTIAAIAYDASNPDNIYVARNSFAPGFPPTLVTSGLTASTDGGQTWNDVGAQQMGTIADLALGIDARYLFLASDRGVSRLALQ